MTHLKKIIFETAEPENYFPSKEWINPYLQILENSSRNFSEIFIFWVVTQAVLLENSSIQIMTETL